MDSANQSPREPEEQKDVELDLFSREERYETLWNLGKGAYGQVDAVKEKSTGKIWARKTVTFSNLEEFGIPSNAIREVTLLKELDHPNLLKVEEVIYARPKLYLYMEYMENDLNKYLEENKPLSNEKIQSIMRQILEGVKSMHSSCAIHRDLKPENIFIDDKGTVKIGDFGISRNLNASSKPMSPEVVTIFYRAPELLLGMKEYSIPIDLWSVGCIFAELYLGKPLFLVESELDLVTKIFKTFGTPNEETFPGITDMISSVMPKYPKRLLKIEEMDENAADLVNKLLALYPTHRISAKEALTHPFFEVDYDN